MQVRRLALVEIQPKLQLKRIFCAASFSRQEETSMTTSAC